MSTHWEKADMVTIPCHTRDACASCFNRLEHTPRMFLMNVLTGIYDEVCDGCAVEMLRFAVKGATNEDDHLEDFPF